MIAIVDFYHDMINIAIIAINAQPKGPFTLDPV